MESLNKIIKESKVPQEMSYVATGKNFYIPPTKTASDPIPTILPLYEHTDEQQETADL